MNDKKTYIIESLSNDELRLDIYLKDTLEISRSQALNLIKNNRVIVTSFDQETNEYKVLKLKPGLELLPGHKIEVYNTFDEFDYLKQYEFELDIKYEDDDVVVVNKGKNMVVHPSITFRENTLVNALLWRYKSLSDLNGDPLRPGILHRIDKDTTGLLIVCKNNKAHQVLAKEMESRTIKRTYFAICYGTFTEQTGTINAPIGRSVSNRLKQAVIKDGRSAITNFEVLKTFKDFSFIKINLETGRTHQIRCHFEYINHPILGDQLYGPKKYYQNYGQFLHAGELTFVQPTTKKSITVKAELPEYFLEELKKLGE